MLKGVSLRKYGGQLMNHKLKAACLYLSIVYFSGSQTLVCFRISWRACESMDCWALTPNSCGLRICIFNKFLDDLRCWLRNYSLRITSL